MTQDATAERRTSAPIATGWLLVLAWVFSILGGLGLIFTLLLVTLGPGPLTRTFGIRLRIPEFGVWDGVRTAVSLAFTISCVGVIMQDRDFAWFAVILAWCVAAIQCVDAFLKIFHLTLSVPIGVVVYAAFAIKLSSNLRRAVHTPPGSGGML